MCWKTGDCTDGGREGRGEEDIRGKVERKSCVLRNGKRERVGGEGEMGRSHVFWEGGEEVFGGGVFREGVFGCVCVF